MALSLGVLTTEKTARILTQHPKSEISEGLGLHQLSTAINTLFRAEIAPITLISGYMYGFSGRKRSAEETSHVAVKRVCREVEALRTGGVHCMGDYSYKVGGDRPISHQQRRFELHVGGRQGPSARGGGVAWQFHAEVVGNGEIAILSADGRRYTRCGDAVKERNKTKVTTSTTTAIADRLRSLIAPAPSPTHSYGTVVQAVADLIRLGGDVQGCGV